MNLAYIYNCTLTPNPNFDHRAKRNLHISYVEITHEITCFENELWLHCSAVDFVFINTSMKMNQNSEFQLLFLVIPVSIIPKQCFCIVPYIVAILHLSIQASHFILLAFYALHFYRAQKPAATFQQHMSKYCETGSLDDVTGASQTETSRGFKNAIAENH